MQLVIKTCTLTLAFLKYDFSEVLLAVSNLLLWSLDVNWRDGHGIQNLVVSYIPV